MSKKDKTEPRGTVATIPVWCRFDEGVTLESLVPHPRNYNKHPDTQIALLAKIIKAQGWRNPVVVSKRSGFVVKGHGRIEAARLMQVDAVPVEYQDYETEAAEYADMIADNRIAELAEPDNAMLKDLLQELDTGEMDMDLTGFDAGELERLMTQFNPEDETDSDAEAQIDRAEELNEKWNVKTGDLWLIGDHRLLCGDSTKAADVARLMGGEKADLCFTSPPYNLGRNVGLSTRNKKSNAYDGYNDDANEAEWLDLVQQSLDAAASVSPFQMYNIQILAGNKLSLAEFIGNNRHRLADIGVWTKRNPQPAMAVGVMDSAFEFVFMFSNDDKPTRKLPGSFRGTVSNVYSGTVNSENESASIHSAAMPVGLCVHFTKQLDVSVYYEPFLGTGTTMVAAQNLGRKCYGLEIAPTYCAVILERMITAFPEIDIRKG
jgi:hypothetical protein